jgi:hypothetical protein
MTSVVAALAWWGKAVKDDETKGSYSEWRTWLVFVNDAIWLMTGLMENKERVDACD